MTAAHRHPVTDSLPPPRIKTPLVITLERHLLGGHLLIRPIDAFADIAEQHTIHLGGRVSVVTSGAFNLRRSCSQSTDPFNKSWALSRII